LSLGSIPLLETPPAADVARLPTVTLIGNYVEQMRHVAAASNVLLVDHYSDWLQRGNGAAPLAFLDDEIHPNARGHLVLAGKLFEELGVFDPNSPTCALASAARDDGGAG
jgi:acyl-CoA thioesterase I